MINRDRTALLALAICPTCGASLSWEGDAIRCAGSGRHAFRAPDGVPHLYPNGAAGDYDRRGLVAGIKHFVLARPFVYDLVQRHLGGDIAPPLVKALAATGGKTVLDLGAGTGMIAGHLPPGATYVWLDNDVVKLRGLEEHDVECLAVIGDASRLPLADESVDFTATASVSHHLPDEAFAGFVAEAARVTREALVFLDAVKTPRLTSRVLWAGDLGRHPRTEDEIVSALGRHFDVDHIERFRTRHDYVLLRCHPRRGSDS
jgi:SAM-dependent methyltransferase